jgi:hypothetical protein
MQGPFEVGEQYRNRDGEYEVIEIDAPQMVIKYEDGRVIETPIDVQARIWRNVMMDEEFQRKAREKAARAKRRRKRKQRRGRSFEGLEAEDFKTDITGTSWRRREDLGGLLAQEMTDDTPHFFQSHAMYRQPEVHIAQPEYYERKQKEKKAKYFFQLDEERATFGLYIEKHDGPMDEAWHWTNLVAGLAEIQDELEQAMREHELVWELYTAAGELEARVQAGPETLRWNGKGPGEQVDWEDFIARLGDLDADTAYDLYLCGRLDKLEALSAGSALADDVAEVYQALLPLYYVSTRGEA